MRILRQLAPAVVVALSLAAVAQAQSAPPAPSQAIAPAAPPSAVALLENFHASDVKFDLNDLMDLLRDRRHEGWVLAAYPDPRTSQPLIGAGFSLDLPARDHPQTDPLNPHPFLEPSSADSWQAAGLDPARLDAILDRFHDRMDTWSKRRFRARIPALEPQITEAEATQLLRVGAIQAVYNARAYCRNFDQLTASQQMALSQLVYQMGVNLAEFSQFLSLVNDGFAPSGRESEFWKGVQASLIESQWARTYRGRAIAVIAMLDPAYAASPSAAERSISAVLRPAVVHRRRGHAAVSESVSAVRHRSKRAGAAPRRRSRRKA